jgi:Dolichyl-phosphate-mannose-protein mannosyltransferase
VGVTVQSELHPPSSGKSTEGLAPIEVSTRNASERQPYLAYIVFALCAGIYMLPFMRIVWIGTDEGTLVYGAVRVIHGQVFARDFFEVMGPGTFYWLAAFFKLFGVTFLAARICLFVTSLGTVLLMYFLSRRVCGRYQVLPSVLLIGAYFSALWPIVNHHVDSNFFALLSVACIVLWRRTGRNSLLLAAGAGAGLTTCIIQPKGILLLLAFLAWVWVQHRRRPTLLSSLLRIVGGYSAVLAATLFYFWSQGALRDLIYMNFLWPSQHYGTVNVVPYALGLRQYWSHWAIPIHGVPWLIPLALVLFVPYLLAAALPGLVPLLGIPLRKDNLKPEILLYWMCGWAIWLSEFHRRDIGHLVAGSPLLIILCVHFLTEYRGKMAALALQFLAICAGSLAAVNLLLVLSAPTVATRVGSVAMFKPDPALAFLDSHVAPGTEIFAYPYCPMYYFLSGTENPTRYSLLVYNYNTPSQFLEVIHVLDRQKVNYILWDTKFYATAGISNFVPQGHAGGSGFLMENYLESHYRVVQDIDGIRIMERKANNHADRR